MVYQVTVSAGQLFLQKSAFNPGKASDFLDGALKVLNAYCFSQKLVTLHWFVLLAGSVFFFF